VIETARNLRVLIIGVDGNIGSALASHLRNLGAVVYGTSRRPQVKHDGTVIALDLADPKQIDRSFPEVDCVVFCAAMARFADCRDHPNLAYLVNVTTPSGLAEKFVRRGAYVVLLSTSAVFDSQSAFRLADDPVSPITEYGRLKAIAEREFLQFSQLGAVFRLTKVIDRENGLFKEWKNALIGGTSINAFVDHVFSPLPIKDVVEELAAVLMAREPGIFQISGANDITYYDAAVWLSHWLNVPSSLVHPAFASDHGIPTNETLKNTTMEVSRLNAMTGYHPPSAEKVLSGLDFGCQV